MIERGLSAKTISQIRRLIMNDAFDNSEYAMRVKQYLDRLDKEQEERQSLDRIKLLQLFIDKDLFQKVYKDEIDESKKNRLDIKNVDMQSVNKLLENIKI